MSHLTDTNGNVISITTGANSTSVAPASPPAYTGKIAEGVLEQLEKQTRINESLQKQITILKDMVLAIAGNERLLLETQEYYWITHYDLTEEKYGPFATAEGAYKMRNMLGLNPNNYYVAVDEKLKF